MSSAIEWEQTRMTQSLLCELSAVPVLGPIAFSSVMGDDWPKGIDELATDPIIAALGDTIMSVA